MFDHHQWTNGGKAMNAITDVDAAQQFARSLEDREARRLGVSISEARRKVARSISASPGFLENLRRGRIKKIPSWTMQKIREAFIAALQAEVRRLEHEIHLARQTGIDPRDDDLVAAETQIEAAKKILDLK